MATIEAPFTLTEVSKGVTLTDSVADLESAVVTYVVPKGMAVAFREGDKFTLVLADGTGAALPDDTIIRVYIADPTGQVYKVVVVEAKLGEVKKLTGALEEIYRLPAGFSRSADEQIIITALGKTAAAKANTKLRMTGVQVVRIG